MARIKKKEPAGNKIDIWIRVVPIALTAIGLFFTIYKGCQPPSSVNDLKKQSWQKTREVYDEISDLAGKIIVAKSSDNDSMLVRLFHEFNSYRVVKLKSVNESKRVNDQMTNLYALYDDAIHHREDIFNPDALVNACRQLADSIKVSRNEGDIKYGKPD